MRKLRYILYTSALVVAIASLLRCFKPPEVRCVIHLYGYYIIPPYNECLIWPAGGAGYPVSASASSACVSRMA